MFIIEILCALGEPMHCLVVTPPGTTKRENPAQDLNLEVLDVHILYVQTEKSSLARVR